MSFSLDDFIEAASRAGRSPTYISETTAYVEKLQERNYPVLFSLQHLAIEMGVKSDMLKWIIEKRRLKYSYFKLPKRKGGFREIMIPTADLKFVQSWIAKNILSKYPLTASCCGFRKDYSTVRNAEVHSGARIILKVDLLKFYDTVTERRISGVFRAMGYHPNLAGPADHLKRHSRKTGVNETNRSAFQDWLLGSIAYIYSVDKKTGDKMLEEFNKIDWTIH